VPFTPDDGHPPGALLAMAVGDLVRVTSTLEIPMYHGFAEGQTDKRGWFPARNVVVVEDPLSDELDVVPVQIGAPQLPAIPEFLRSRGA